MAGIHEVGCVTDVLGVGCLMSRSVIVTVGVDCVKDGITGLSCEMGCVPGTLGVGCVKVV